MLDIISQDEIDRLLSILIEDSDWPQYLLMDREKIVKLNRDSPEISDLFKNGEIREYDITKMYEDKGVKQTVLFENKSLIATYFLTSLSNSRDDGYEVKTTEKRFMVKWLEDHPEYHV